MGSESTILRTAGMRHLAIDPREPPGCGYCGKRGAVHAARPGDAARLIPFSGLTEIAWGKNSTRDAAPSMELTSMEAGPVNAYRRRRTGCRELPSARMDNAGVRAGS